MRLPADGVPRLWAKSDPATTSVIDRASAEYIVHSEEGKKYYHFFKYTLVGAEEHYFASLLGNWERTRDAIHRTENIPVFNTWALGKLDVSSDKSRNKHEKTVHTSYLGNAELDLLKGLSEIGVFFARKFTSNSSQVLDRIDSELLDKKARRNN